MNKKLKRKLIDALLGCPTISDRASRDMVVNELPDEIKNNIKRHSTTRVDLVHIVNTCENYPDGIEPLIKSVRLIEGSSITMQKVDDVWSRSLFAIASNANLTNETLDKLYRATLPTDLLARLPQANTLWARLEHLWDAFPEPDGTRPIFAFAERLACHADDTKQPSVANRLRCWTEQMASSFELTIADIERMRTEIESETRQMKNEAGSDDSYLLVTLMPEGQNRNRPKQQSFQVQISLWKNKKEMTDWYNENIFHPLDQIRPLIDQVISNQRERPKRVEFFLPYELIAHEVDQWQMQEDLWIETTFGSEYEVVVRSVDRLTSFKQFFKLWQDKWQLFQDLVEAPCDTHLFWICEREQYRPRKLVNLLRSKEKICLGLTFIPQKRRVFGAMLQSGVPIALWSRACDQMSVEARDLQSKMKAIVSNKMLSHLPHIVLAERQQAYEEEDESHLGNHLTLFWDDPNRIPPKFQSRLGFR